MKIGFHYHSPAIIKEDNIFMPAYLGLFIDSLAPFFEEIICFLHTPNSLEEKMMDYCINSNNVKLVNLGEHNSIPKRMLNGKKIGKIFQEYEPEFEALLLRASTPLLPFITKYFNKPIALMLVSDATSGLENLPQPYWRKKLITLWANWYSNKELLLAIKSLTIVNSQMIYDNLKDDVKNIHLIRTTTLSNSDFYDREDTCTNKKIRLIFAGRISRIKGLLDIIDAMGTLIKEGFDLELKLVGMVDKTDSILKEINYKALSLGIEDSYEYIGYKTAGSELLEEYRKSDIFVIASQANSEGFPRTLWEAMASSLPIVATSVSSIPNFTEGAAELAPPKNVIAYTESLRRVLTSSKRRKQMIKKGMELAKNNTLEQRGKELSNILINNFN